MVRRIPGPAVENNLFELSRSTPILKFSVLVVSALLTLAGCSAITAISAIPAGAQEKSQNKRQADKNPKVETVTPLDADHAREILKDPRFAQPPDWAWKYFKNADSAKLRYGYAPGASSLTPKGTVVILPGFTEFGEVYFETAKEFRAHGYAVYELDWRGSGGSDRDTKNPSKAISLALDHDEDDLDQFLNTIVRKNCTGPIFLVAHSLGSHVVLRYLHDHPGVVTRAVLSAPPFDAPGTTASPWMVSAYSWVLWKMNKGDHYVDGQGDWKFMAPKISKMYTHSHDPVRVRLEEAWATVNPALQSGGATWKWLFLFQQSCDIVTNETYDKAINTPILFGCALSDRIANPKHEQKIAAVIPHCQVYEAADARHDLFLEDDAHRQPWMQAVFDFLR